jgi:glycosyltransferase involved in cell wall biosynthesis
MKIALIAAYNTPGDGLYEYTHDLKRELTHHHQVSFHQLFVDSKHQKESIWNIYFSPHYYPLSQFLYHNFDLINLHLSFWYFRQRQFTAVDYLNLINFIRFIAKPTIITLHSEFNQSFCDDYHYLIQQLLNLKHVRFIVHSSIQQQNLIKLTNHTPAKINLIPHGCKPLKALSISEISQYNVLKRKYKDYKIIVSLGLIGPWKNQLFLISLFPKLIKVYPKVMLFILGSNRQHPLYYQQCLHKVRQLNLPHQIILRGKYLNLSTYKIYLHLADIYAASHFYLDQPSSGTLAYALSAGKAIVGLPIDYLRQPDIRKAILLANDEPEYIAHLLNLLTNASLRHQLERQAKQTSTSWAWPLVASQYLTVYLSLVHDYPHRLRSPRRMFIFNNPLTFQSWLHNFDKSDHLQLIHLPFHRFNSVKLYHRLDNLFIHLQISLWTLVLDHSL